MLSPEYVAFIVITFGGFPDAVYNAAHVPEESVHEVTLKLPPALPSLHETVPIGTVGEFDESLTNITNFAVPLGDRIAGFGLIEDVVRCKTFTIRAETPALPEWLESPP